MQVVQKYFGDIPAVATPTFAEPAPPVQVSERTETMYDANATLPAFHIAYHIPPNRSPDHYALEILALVLGDGESSRLYQSLVKKRKSARTWRSAPMTGVALTCFPPGR